MIAHIVIFIVSRDTPQQQEPYLNLATSARLDGKIQRPASDRSHPPHILSRWVADFQNASNMLDTSRKAERSLDIVRMDVTTQDRTVRLEREGLSW